MPSISAEHDKTVEILLMVLMEKLAKHEYDLPPLPPHTHRVYQNHPVCKHPSRLAHAPFKTGS